MRSYFLNHLVLISLLLIQTNYVSAQSLLEAGVPNFSGNIEQLENVYHKQVLPTLVKELSKAVVNISVEIAADDQANKSERSDLPLLPGNPFRSAGSGFIIRKDGYIVTCSHVIEKANKVIVRLLDVKEEFTAKIIGRDPKTDLALLKIESKDPLPAVYVGDSDQVEVGEWVLAIGNQFQLGQTVTSGIVSAKARKVPTKGTPYDSFIQTDASINPGSSGGPLFNARGQVVGINSAIFSPGHAQLGTSGFNIGIGFAVPVNLLKQIIGELQSSGSVKRGMLGVRIQGVDKSIQKALKLPTLSGALVSEVLADTPASKAGVKRRDVITHFNNTLIEDFDQLPLLVANTKIGSEISLSLVRKGKQLTIPAVVSQDVGGEIGISVEELTESQAKALGLESPGGIFVMSVTPGSLADRAGIRKGDLIEEVGDLLISSRQVLAKALAALKNEEHTLVTVRRTDGTRILTLGDK
jgi:serine protease Do